jgi:hypothetical protein
MPLHRLPPVFVIVECSHHRLTSSSPYANPPLLFLSPETQIKKKNSDSKRPPQYQKLIELRRSNKQIYCPLFIEDAGTLGWG